MNLVIETLNVWADHALRFAWPMLWQSSLLIALLFALELLLKRKVRSAVRYALWLVVLVKLLLPPSLAFPTSAGWWLRPANAKPTRPRPTSVVVTYGTPERPLPPTIVKPVCVEPPPPHLSSDAWLLVGMVAVSLALLAWMIVRWCQVSRRAHRAAAAPVPLDDLLPELRHPVRLRLTDHPESPALCGLCRPVILLPRSLAERLPPAQLRAVLLHELVHLRRGDVWVNCAQALLQIVYWWHPLLWLANARIRRVREEAVDDAVMLALKEDAETYAPTLLEVAKLALHRPLASLGLVGILESRSSLHQRIERLLDFRPPRKAGLTLGSALAVLGFAALAVPMGEAPAPSEVAQSATRPSTPNNSAPDVLSSSGAPVEPQPLYIRTFKISEDTLAAGLHVPLGPLGTNGPEGVFHAFRDWFSQAGVDLDPARNPGKACFYSSGLLMVRATLQDLDTIERKIAELRADAGSEPPPGRVPGSPSGSATTNGSILNDLISPTLTAEQQAKVSTLVQDGKLLYEMGKLDEADAKLKLALKEDPNSQVALYYLDLVSKAKFTKATKLHEAAMRQDIRAVEQAWANQVHSGQGREAIITRLERIRLDSVAYNALPLGEVVRGLTEESRKRDPSGLGVKFVLESGADANVAGEGAVDHLTGQSKPARSGAPSDLSSIPITIQPPLTNVALVDVLDAVMKVAGRPMKYVISDEGIFFSARPEHEPPPLYVRTFKVDPNAMLEALHLAKGQAEKGGVEGVIPALLDYFARAGVDLDPTRNPGKSLFYKDRQGVLLIRATLQDLDIIEVVLQMLNSVPPQINLKCKVVAVPQNDTKALGFDWYLGNMLMTNGSTGPEAGSTFSSNLVPTTAKPPGTFPGDPHASTTNEPGVNAKLLTSGLHLGNNPPFPLCGILTDPQYRVVIKALQQRDGPELLLSTEVTTSSGRQVQCKTTEVHSLVKINQQALTPPGITSTNDDESFLYVAEPMEFGVVLDAVPTVFEDGFTIRMPVVGTVLEFLGYEDARTNRVAPYVNGKRKWVNPPLPCLRTQQMASTVNVWDGQTVVLGGLVSERTTAFKDKVPMLGDLPLLGRLFRREGETTQKRNLLIFITPTIIDPAGNRVHSDGDMPFTRDAIPQQPSR
jgi:general secretion pathway protein D